MIHSSEDVLSSFIGFVEGAKQVELYCPYIRTSILQKILASNRCSRIVVRWDVEDIVRGVTDFESLYEFCVDREISLYHNKRIHLKVIVDKANDKICYGSANFTGRGMGKGRYNYELSGVERLDSVTKLYLESIVYESRFVTGEYYRKLLDQVIAVREDFKDFKKLRQSLPILEVKGEIEEPFLMSSLPMSESPERLWEEYGNMNELGAKISDIALADLANYSLELNLSREEFFHILSTSFNIHPFIDRLKKAIRHSKNQFFGFGQLSQWLIQNTTTVPTPRKWDLKDRDTCLILHRWITFFDSSYISEIRYPNGSDRLVYLSSSIYD